VTDRKRVSDHTAPLQHSAARRRPAATAANDAPQEKRGHHDVARLTAVSPAKHGQRQEIGEKERIEKRNDHLRTDVRVGQVFAKRHSAGRPTVVVVAAQQSYSVAGVGRPVQTPETRRGARKTPRIARQASPGAPARRQRVRGDAVRGRRRLDTDAEELEAATEAATEATTEAATEAEKAAEKAAAKGSRLILLHHRRQHRVHPVISEINLQRLSAFL